MWLDECHGVWVVRGAEPDVAGGADDCGIERAGDHEATLWRSGCWVQALEDGLGIGAGNGPVRTRNPDACGVDGEVVDLQRKRLADRFDGVPVL